MPHLIGPSARTAPAQRAPRRSRVQTTAWQQRGLVPYPQWFGVNLVDNILPGLSVPLGVYGTDYQFPSDDQVRYFARHGLTLLRFVTCWEYWQPQNGQTSPATFGALDAGQVARLTHLLDVAQQEGARVMFDLANSFGYSFPANSIFGPSTNTHFTQGTSPGQHNTWMINQVCPASIPAPATGPLACSLDQSRDITTTGSQSFTLKSLSAGSFDNVGVGARLNFDAGAVYPQTNPSFETVTLTAWQNNGDGTATGTATFTLPHLYNHNAIVGDVFVNNYSVPVPVGAWLDLWTKLVQQFGGHPAIAGWDILNEPNDFSGWNAQAQACITTIRNLGDTHPIFVQMTALWTTYTDPANNLIYHIHRYFDGNSIGLTGPALGSMLGGPGVWPLGSNYEHWKSVYEATQPSYGGYEAIGVANTAAFITWLRANGLRGFLGEYSVPRGVDGSSPLQYEVRYLPILDAFMATLAANSDVIYGGTYFAAGAYYSSDFLGSARNFTVLPDNIGVPTQRDAPQMAVLQKYPTTG